ncbi:MAG TPA: tripartite tricarboxylate transporter substrate-binding protein [Phototrophicaceae bacterium]|nr:tripartite tricarboxylate transporter substrate-binding protein [Phototrophicaceae bacterium]
MHQLLGRQILLATIVATLNLCNWTHAVDAQPFYAGKNITMLISTSPGGATDVAGRLVMRHLGKYLPGQPNFIAQNMPGAGGIVAANYLSNVAKPDGLTLLAVNRANYLEQMVGRPEVKLDFRRLNWVGSFNRAPMMIVCRKDTPYSSIDAMRSAKAPARFGEGGTGSISFVFSSLVGEILDFKVKRHRLWLRARNRSRSRAGRSRLPGDIGHHIGATALAHLGASRLRLISGATGADEKPAAAANSADYL